MVGCKRGQQQVTNSKGLVSGRTWSCRWRKELNWNVDTQACREQEVIHTGSTSHYSRRCSRRMHQGHPQKDWCVSCLLNSSSILPPLDADIVQTFWFCFQTPTWLTALAIFYAQTPFHWNLSTSPNQEPLDSTRNTAVGGIRRATARSAQLWSRGWREYSAQTFANP